MCGIAAAIHWEGAAGAVLTMIDGLHHRGVINDPLSLPLPHSAMATRRLPIVDAAHGIQPQLSWNGRVLVCFNGEIYNHAALRHELEATGARFRTNSDTEVLATALSIWGPQTLTRLDGMFAFVALDIVSGHFLAARDMFGAKPLYLIQDGQGFLFCSEIRPLLLASDTGDVLLLPPGHVLTKDRCVRFKSFQAGAKAPKRQGEPIELDHLLARAVEARIPPDLPFALMFSGGIDSTLITHYARRTRPEAPGYFLGGEASPDYEYAARYAGMSGLDLRIVEMDAGDPGKLIPIVTGMVESFEPEVVRGSLCSYHLARRVHGDGYHIALCGEGADELFAGYIPLELAFADSDIAGIFVRDQHLGTFHKTALQRIDRCGMHFQVEFREPFLDGAVTSHALGLAASSLIEEVDGYARGKAPLRALYDLYPGQLPPAIRDRRKVPMNEGCGFDSGQSQGPWVDYANETIGDKDFAEGQKRFAPFDLRTKEEFLYLDALAATMDVFRVPHLTDRARLKFPNVRNSSMLKQFFIAETK